MTVNNNDIRFERWEERSYTIWINNQPVVLDLRGTPACLFTVFQMLQEVFGDVN